MNERAIVEQLRGQLAPRYVSLLVHRNLAVLTPFKNELRRQFGYVPVLNEVDMVLVRKNRDLCAIEVKCFDLRGGRLSRPFYDGVGQALSLLRYGFDHVALWHVFSADIDQARLDRYGAATWWFVRNQLDLPLDFSYFRVDGTAAAPSFMVMQYAGPNSAADLVPVDKHSFDVTWKHPNPLSQDDDARRLRASLVSALGLDEFASR